LLVSFGKDELASLYRLVLLARPRQHKQRDGVRRADRPEIVFSHLMEGIGLALDPRHGRMFVTDFGGSVYSANLDGSDPKTLLVAEGNLTGIAHVELPATEGAIRPM